MGLILGVVLLSALGILSVAMATGLAVVVLLLIKDLELKDIDRELKLVFLPGGC